MKRKRTCRHCKEKFESDELSNQVYCSVCLRIANSIKTAELSKVDRYTVNRLKQNLAARFK